jgi:hypothetical protein
MCMEKPNFRDIKSGMGLSHSTELHCLWHHRHVSEALGLKAPCHHVWLLVTEIKADSLLRNWYFQGCEHFIWHKILCQIHEWWGNDWNCFLVIVVVLSPSNRHRIFLSSVQRRNEGPSYRYHQLKLIPVFWWSSSVPKKWICGTHCAGALEGQLHPKPYLYMNFSGFLQAVSKYRKDSWQNLAKTKWGISWWCNTESHLLFNMKFDEKVFSTLLFPYFLHAHLVWPCFLES